MKIYKKRRVFAARVPKTVNTYVLQGDYGYGWDDLVSYDHTSQGYSEALQDKISYRKNQPAAYRIIERRVANPEWIDPNMGPTYEEVTDYLKNECPYEVQSGNTVVYIRNGKESCAIYFEENYDKKHRQVKSFYSYREHEHIYVKTMDELITEIDKELA